jgi:hypothetical protein
MDTLDRLILGYINPESCEFASNADPYTGSTSRPPLDPIGREIKIKGPFCSGGGNHDTAADEAPVMDAVVEESVEDPPRRGLRS